MKDTITAALAALCLAACILPDTAKAGPYGDDLSKCMISHSSAADQSLLMQFMFATISLHPDFAPMVTITQAQRDAIEDKTAALYRVAGAS